MKKMKKIKKLKKINYTLFDLFDGCMYLTLGVKPDFQANPL